jgi:hypothetical protein
MGNALLKENKGKKGSYTIRVKSDYAVPKRSLKEIVTSYLKINVDVPGKTQSE